MDSCSHDLKITAVLFESAVHRHSCQDTEGTVSSELTGFDATPIDVCCIGLCSHDLKITAVLFDSAVHRHSCQDTKGTISPELTGFDATGIDVCRIGFLLS